MDLQCLQIQLLLCLALYGLVFCLLKLPSSSIPSNHRACFTGFYSQFFLSLFQISGSNVGKLTKIRLEHDNTGSAPDWKVDYVRFVNCIEYKNQEILCKVSLLHKLLIQNYLAVAWLVACPLHMSRNARKPIFGVPTRSDTNRAVKPQKTARDLNFGFKKLGDCTIYVAKTGADQLRSYCAAGLRLCFHICKKQVFP